MQRDAFEPDESLQTREIILLDGRLYVKTVNIRATKLSSCKIAHNNISERLLLQYSIQMFRIDGRKEQSLQNASLAVLYPQSLMLRDRATRATPIASLDLGAVLAFSKVV